MSDVTVIHPPSPGSRTVQITVPRIDSRSTLADRISLRLGLWLLLASARRAEHRAEHLDRARHRAHTSVLEQYEREAAHTQLLMATRAWR